MSSIESTPRNDAWMRIARFVPNVREDLVFLRDHWNAIDAALDANGLTTEEDALRRALRNDLPRIAETLEGAMAIAATDDERRAASARALGSVEDLLGILKAHRQAIFDAACADQEVVGRYLETKRGDVAPTGPLALDSATADLSSSAAARSTISSRTVDGCVLTTHVIPAVARIETRAACSFCGLEGGGTRVSINGGKAICVSCAERAAATEAAGMRKALALSLEISERNAAPIGNRRPSGRNGRRRKALRREDWEHDGVDMFE